MREVCGCSVTARPPACPGLAQLLCLVLVHCEDAAGLKATLQEQHAMAPEGLKALPAHCPTWLLWVQPCLHKQSFPSCCNRSPDRSESVSLPRCNRRCETSLNMSHQPEASNASLKMQSVNAMKAADILQPLAKVAESLPVLYALAVGPRLQVSA